MQEEPIREHIEGTLGHSSNKFRIGRELKMKYLLFQKMKDIGFTLFTTDLKYSVMDKWVVMIRQLMDKMKGFHIDVADMNDGALKSKIERIMKKNLREKKYNFSKTHIYVVPNILCQKIQTFGEGYATTHFTVFKDHIRTSNKTINIRGSFGQSTRGNPAGIFLKKKSRRP